MVFIRLPILILCTISIHLSINSSAQFVDSFSQVLHPSWQGNRDHFAINSSSQLQLMAPEAGSSWLYRPIPAVADMRWNCDFILDFPPSSANQILWIIQGNQMPIDQISGYGVRWGESGNDDAIELVRLDEGQLTPLLRLTNAAVATSPSRAKIEVEKKNNQFTIRADYTMSGTYTDSAKIIDATYPTTFNQLTGLFCQYTSTRVDLFSFDNYSVQRLSPDIDGPQLLQYSQTDSSLTLDFNELIQDSTLDITIRPTIPLGTPEIIPPGNRLLLPFLATLTANQEYEVTISGLQDILGNQSPDTSFSFLYEIVRQPNPFDLLISEFMPAPSTQTSLPNVEYIELFNRSSSKLTLDHLILSDASTQAHFPPFTIAVEEYVIICDITDTASLSPYGKCIGLKGFPTLNNGVDKIHLSRSDGTKIHSISYNDSWYQDMSKDDGGWSIELISDNGACSGAAAYKASEDPRGGSPGQENSIWQSSFRDSLVLDQIEVPSESQINVTFSQQLSLMQDLMPEDIRINPPLAIDAIILSEDHPQSIILYLAEAIQKGSFYRLQISADLQNCLSIPAGNQLVDTFGLPELAERNDLKISEVLFAPNTGEVQWLEIYNAGDRFLSWDELFIRFEDETGSDQFSIPSSSLLLPGRYYVVTEDAAQIARVYDAPNPTQIIEIDMPSMNRERGRIILDRISVEGAAEIDRICYDEEWHSGFLREERGVSLERIALSFDESCKSSYWQSAAKSARYGTPTGVNSQRLVDRSAEERFSLSSPTFSPDGDGFEDFLYISFTEAEHTDPPQLDLRIYTPDGILVRTRYSNYRLATTDILDWDGTNDEGYPLPKGFYQIQARTTNENGQRSHWQSTVYLYRQGIK